MICIIFFQPFVLDLKEHKSFIVDSDLEINKN